MIRLKVIKDLHNKFYIGLRFYGSYDIGYWKQVTKKYKSVNRLIKYNPAFYAASNDVQEI